MDGAAELGIAMLLDEAQQSANEWLPPQSC